MILLLKRQVKSLTAQINILTGIECARRWHEVEKPTISRDRWSLYEVVNLTPALPEVVDNRLIRTICYETL